MVSNTPNSTDDTDRAFADIASMMAGNSGFAEATMTAFKGLGIAGDVPSDVRANIQLVVDDNVNELRNAIDAAVNDIVTRAGGNVSDPNIQRAIALLQGASSPRDLVSRMATAERELDSAQDRMESANGPLEQRLQEIQGRIDDIYARQREILEEARRNGQISEEQYRKGIEAIDQAQEANRVYGPGTEQTAAANERVDQVIAPIATTMNAANPGSGDELLTNQGEVRQRDGKARGIRTQIREQVESRNTAAASTTQNNLNTPIATGGLFASALNRAPADSTLNVNESSSARLEYTEAAEGQPVTPAATPALAPVNGPVTQL